MHVHALNACTETVIRFFEGSTKYKHLYPNGYFFLTAKYKILQLYPDGHSFFYSKIQNFEHFIQTVIGFFTTKYKVLKVVPKQPFVFPCGKSNYL